MLLFLNLFQLYCLHMSACVPYACSACGGQESALHPLEMGVAGGYELSWGHWESSLSPLQVLLTADPN